MRQLSGTLDCEGFTHQLVVDGPYLRAPDHEDEASKVFEVLAGPSACQVACEAWQWLVHSLDERDDKPDFSFAQSLIPDPNDAEWYASHLAEGLTEPDRIELLLAAMAQHHHPTAVDPDQMRRSAHRRTSLLQLPPHLRSALALHWVTYALDGGLVRDPIRVGRLRLAVAACWDSFGEQGPSSRARALLVWDLRAHRWGAPR